jgi:hypothetical protein
MFSFWTICLPLSGVLNSKDSGWLADESTYLQKVVKKRASSHLPREPEKFVRTKHVNQMRSHALQCLFSNDTGLWTPVQATDISWWTPHSTATKADPVCIRMA